MRSISERKGLEVIEAHVSNDYVHLGICMPLKIKSVRP